MEITFYFLTSFPESLLVSLIIYLVIIINLI